MLGAKELDSIFLTRMQFYGRHGVHREETALGQRFIVSVRLAVDCLEAGLHDDLQLTVNYGEVYNVIKGIVQGTPFKLLEALAQAVADAVLGHFSFVARIEVTIEKPGAPIDGIFDTVGVQIERCRE